MNTVNNKRRKDSQKRIESAFITLIQELQVTEITITNICELASVNRSTFYANYLDIHDLANKIKKQLEEEVSELYKDEREHHYNSNDFLKLFKHIKENQLFYKTYFKLGFDADFKIIQYDTSQAKVFYNDEFIEYHIIFFKSGLTAIIKLWIEHNCLETPEELYSIIKAEYLGKLKSNNI